MKRKTDATGKNLKHDVALNSSDLNNISGGVVARRDGGWSYETTDRKGNIHTNFASSKYDAVKNDRDTKTLYDGEQDDGNKFGKFNYKFQYSDGSIDNMTGTIIK